MNLAPPSAPALAASQPPPLAARIGLFAGPVLAVTVFWLLPAAELPFAARATGAVAALMAVWWMTEALPLEATALLPLVLLPLAGIYDGKDAFKRAAAPYADPAIFLLLSGFMIALAIEKWNLHRRLALLTLLTVGTSPRRLVAGFLLATGLISMWISNTATAVMMLPIGLAVVRLLTERMGQPSDDPASAAAAQSSTDAANLAVSLMLAIAYAASLGGFATLVGTPPNIYFAGYLRDQGLSIDFGRWMMFAAPLSCIYLIIAWWLLTRWLFPVKMTSIPGGHELVLAEFRKLGAVSRGEWIVLTVFSCTALLWISHGYLADWTWFATRFPIIKSLDDSAVAMLGALALFLIPVHYERRQFALDWQTAVKLPWGVLLLFGGGLSLAAALTDTGLAKWIGQQVGVLAALPTFWQITIIVALIVFTGELTSNLAAVVALLPILFEVGTALNLDPLLLCVPAVVAASCGFMLPVATPPNAIVFGAGHVRLGQMVRAGFLLDLVAVILIPIATYLLGPLLLGIKL